MKLFEGAYYVHDNGHEYHNEVLIRAYDSITADGYFKHYLETLYEDEKPEWNYDRWYFSESDIYVKPGFVCETTKKQWMAEKYESALI